MLDLSEAFASSSSNLHEAHCGCFLLDRKAWAHKRVKLFQQVWPPPGHPRTVVVEALVHKALGHVQGVPL